MPIPPSPVRNFQLRAPPHPQPPAPIAPEGPREGPSGQLRVYAFVTAIEAVPGVDGGDAFAVVVECLDAEWFEQTWQRFAPLPEVVDFTRLLGANRIEAIYGRLNASQRLLFYRVHMHYQLYTVAAEAPAPISLAQLRLAVDAPALKFLTTATWYELVLAADPSPAGGEADFAELREPPDPDAPVRHLGVADLAELAPERLALLLALYFPQALLSDRSGQVEDVVMGGGDERRGRKRGRDDDGDAGRSARRPRGGGGGGELVLPPGPPLPPLPPFAPPPPLPFQPFVGVFNIGAGNCIGLFDTTGSICAFTDFGYPTPPNVNTWPGGPFPDVTSDPVIVLSHWDYDHYAMAVQQPQAGQLRWLAPQQVFGAAGGRLVYMAVLLNSAAAVGNAALYLWPIGAAGHLAAPWGYIERGTGGGANDNCLVAFAQVTGGPIAASWPAPLSVAGLPIPGAGLVVPPLPIPVPGAYAGLPALGVPAAGALPAGPIAAPPVPGLPPLAGQRFILLPGDNAFLSIPSLGGGGGPPGIVGMVAAHHGAQSWLPAAAQAALAGYVGGLPAAGVAGQSPPATMTDRAGLNLAQAITPALAAVVTGLQIPPAPGQPFAPFPAPAFDPRVVAGVIGGGRIVYSYGIRPAAPFAHPYNHPRDPAIVAYMLQGWSSRLDTPLTDFNSQHLYFPGWPGAAVPGGPPVPHRAGGVALGWQDDGTGAGNDTYLWRDITPAGFGALGGVIVRPRTPPAVGPAYVFEY